MRVERRVIHGEVGLEVLTCPQSEQGERAPIVFVHGGYVGAWCWEDHFLPWFGARGYPVYALSLRGHGKSEGRDRLDSAGLADYAHDLATVVATLSAPPILVGHSMGALVVQKYFETQAAESSKATRAAVLACPVPSYGLLPSTFALAWTRPDLLAGMNQLAAGGTTSLETIGKAMFAGELPPERLTAVYARMRRESKRALVEMSGWGLPSLWRQRRPRTLVLGASRDALFPEVHARSTATLLGAEYQLLEGLGHAVMLDQGWETAAETIAIWLRDLSS